MMEVHGNRDVFVDFVGGGRRIAKRVHSHQAGPMVTHTTADRSTELIAGIPPPESDKGWPVDVGLDALFRQMRQELAFEDFATAGAIGSGSTVGHADDHRNASRIYLIHPLMRSACSGLFGRISPAPIVPPPRWA